MLENKRKFERFSLPLVVSFRPTYGETEYSMGLMKNFSCGGLALETKKFSFIKYESLELNLRFPQSGSFASLFGYVIWKSQTGDKCIAGVKFKEMDEETQNQILEKISSLGNIPVDSILLRRDHKFVDEPDVKSAEKPSKKKRKTSKKPKKTGFTKQYFKGGSRCKVTFRLPKDAAPEAKNITIVGDFNEWNLTKTPMKKLKSGDYQITMELPCNSEFKFRYLIDGHRWENDWHADRYDPNNFGDNDSVVII